MENTGLKSYLNKVYEMESFIYKLERLKENIEEKIKHVKVWKPVEKYSINPNNYVRAVNREWAGMVYLFCFIFMAWVGIIIAGSDFLENFEDWWSSGVWAQNLNILFKIILGFLLYIVGMICKLIFTFRLVAAVVIGFSGGILLAVIAFIIIDKLFSSKFKKEYMNEIRRKNNDIEHNNELIRAEVDKKTKALQAQLNLVNKEIWNAKQTLTQYYDKDIVYKKYRNFVAISSFCEYFESGRCVSLTGHEGAYNIYETEIRQNIIISQLSEVINHLQKIEENQYMIYSAIVDATAAVRDVSNQIDKSLKKIGNGIDSLNQNMEIMEYNTRITAQNTEFIKWLNIFELDYASRNWM